MIIGVGWGEAAEPGSVVVVAVLVVVLVVVALTLVVPVALVVELVVELVDEFSIGPRRFTPCANVDFLATYRLGELPALAEVEQAKMLQTSALATERDTEIVIMCIPITARLLNHL